VAKAKRKARRRKKATPEGSLTVGLTIRLTSVIIWSSVVAGVASLPITSAIIR
jgi:hypothetical protein